MYEDLSTMGKEELEARRNALIKEISKFSNLQQAKKIQLNSAYGALGNMYFRWYRKEFAEAITSSGQLSTRWIERKVNEYLNKTFNVDEDWVIACDTDSVYIRMKTIVDRVFDEDQRNDTEKVVKFLDKLCKTKLEPMIDTWFQQLAEYVNGYEQKMAMKRECIANKGIWTGKKHYILNVYNNEGVAYAEPKLKMMGIEAIRTSTPHVCREAIKKALCVIMNEDEASLQRFISDFREQFAEMSFEQVAFPRSVSDLEKYRDSCSIFIKGTPINVKGALVYNHYIDKINLNKKYQHIASGQKIKFAYCVQPNPLRTSVIAAPGALPKELGMDMYIDNNKQFEKAFLQPLKTITDTIGWHIDRRATLDAFFI